MTKAMEVSEFLANVANHKMSVKLDHGIYRHLVFRSASNSWNQWFGLVTWPGYLTICGDMGTWTFARVDDMFTFFRDDKLRINSYYWAEKLQHGMHAGRDGAKQFDQQVFGKRLLAQLSEYYSFEGEELAQATAMVQEEVLSRHDGEPQYAFLNAAADFCYVTRDGVRWHFDTCELPDGKIYSYQFIWCLYAIVWGIQQYDALKSSGQEIPA